MSVWLATSGSQSTPVCGNGCCFPVTSALSRHLLSACTRLGESVVDLNATDPHFASSALSMGCPITATFADTRLADVAWRALTRAHSVQALRAVDLRVARPRPTSTDPLVKTRRGTAALVLLRQLCRVSPSFNAVAEAADLGVSHRGVGLATELLKPGGYLAVVTGLYQGNGQVDDPVPRIISQAKQAGLTYLQHIIVLHVPARGEATAPTPTAALSDERELSECRALPASTRVHSDLLIFVKLAPAGPPDPPGEDVPVRRNGKGSR
ncbi:hypothetical protein [Acrocarpospora corrugata]|uniref:hypothetical protein n=1 Tax=Acrocarpospora corrugata TaxID=35763 RepID=UPI001C3F6F0C|nr:hypothetical protein [Acrocarpospora corrugata]